MTIDTIRTVILAAVEAARYAMDADPAVAKAITAGEPLELARLGFDSLGWMEFCISVELQTRQELTTTDVEAMVTVQEIEAWLGARLGDARLSG